VTWTARHLGGNPANNILLHYYSPPSVL
jgi:hypothetical protein